MEGYNDSTYINTPASADSATLPDVHIFKTDIESREQLERIAVIFSADPRITRWNVDTQDIDKVLRVESRDFSNSDILKLVKQAGYQCENLPD